MDLYFCYYGDELGSGGIAIKSKNLPKEILDKADSNYRELAWRKEDIPEVLEAAKKTNLKCLGGMPQYRGPSFTCEPYWCFYGPKPRKKDESWKDYSIRSNDETLEMFNLICAETDFSVEILKFQNMKDRVKNEKIIPEDHLWFSLSFRDTPLE